MKKIPFLILIAVFFTACTKDNVSDKDKDVKNQKWFKEFQTPCEESTVCKLRINKALYITDTVYFVSYTGPLCDMYFSVTLINIDGDTIKSYSGPEEVAIFDSEIKNIQTIYWCEKP